MMATTVNLSFWLDNFQNLTYLKLGSNALKLYRIYDTEKDDLLKIVSHNNWDVNKKLLGAWIAHLDVYEY
jgi:hypothetical protein